MRPIFTLLSMWGLGFTACAEPKLCDTSDATFVVGPQAGVRINATLRTRGRHDGTASYQGSWAYAADSIDPSAVALVGPGTHLLWDGAFSGAFDVGGREEEHRVEIVIQRLDDSAIVLEGEVSAEAEAPDGCSLDLVVVPD